MLHNTILNAQSISPEVD